MTQAHLDKPRPIRSGEALDTAKLADYLATQGIEGTLTIQQFPSGFSNLTYAVDVGERQFVLRRPPFGANIKSGHDMGREHRILTQLKPVYPKVPTAIAYCEDESVLGAPFYLMERLNGVILRGNMPPAAEPDPVTMTAIADSTIQNLVALHAVDYAAAGLGDLGRPDGFVQRQVDGWTRRYAKASTDEIPDIDKAFVWLNDNVPAEVDATLIHNDYKYDNLILNPNELSDIVAVLDWEMSTLGDPLMDLGVSLGYWVQPDDPPVMQMMRLSPTNLPGNPTRADVVQQYAAVSGRHVDHVVFYYVYGVTKLAVIVQQIYRRWKLGYTQDSRFEGLIHAVRACGLAATQAIAKQQISGLF